MYLIQIANGKFYKYCIKGLPRYGRKGEAFEIKTLTEARIIKRHLELLAPQNEHVIVYLSGEDKK